MSRHDVACFMSSLVSLYGSRRATPVRGRECLRYHAAEAVAGYGRVPGRRFIRAFTVRLMVFFIISRARALMRRRQSAAFCVCRKDMRALGYACQHEFARLRQARQVAGAPEDAHATGRCC